MSIFVYYQNWSKLQVDNHRKSKTMKWFGKMEKVFKKCKLLLKNTKYCCLKQKHDI